MAADTATATATATGGATLPAERSFRVMGSDAHVVVDAGCGAGSAERLLDRAEARLHQLEARWSRFLPASEISRLNAGEGELTVVSDDTYRLIAAAVDGWAATGGRFDPTVLGDVVRAGYDDSFERIPPDRPHRPCSPMRRGAGDIVVLRSAGVVAVPPGVGVDPGGIGKGLAADIVTEELLGAGAAGVCVNVGGDLRVAGTRAGEHRWVIAVDPAGDGHPVAAVALAAGAVATTTRRRRAWTVAGGEAHHIVDPATGAPARAGLSSVTVLAGECWRAEILAKAAFVAGACEALALVDAAGAACLVVDDDGTVRHSEGMGDFAASLDATTDATTDAANSGVPRR